MKILILCHRTLFPQNGGYPIVVYNTVKALVKQGHNITLLALDEKQRKPVAINDELFEKINYRTYAIDISVGIAGALLNLFSPTAHIVDRYYNEKIEKKLLAEVRRGKYDIIQFEGLFVTPYLPAIRKATGAKLVYRAHNIEHQVWQRLARQKTDPVKKIYLNLLAKRIKKFELQALNSFNAIIAFTGQDETTIRAHGIQTQVEVHPIGVDLDKYCPDYSKTEFPSLFFLGSLSWMPNREGIEWFIENSRTALTTGDLRVRFYLAGGNIPESFDDYEAPGKIYIQGEVDDVLEFINSKSVMIVPLLSGGGMRVKIVEGMAMEKCIISTSLGAEGINYTHGENIIIANTLAEFHEAINRCIADEAYCRRIGKNARKLVEQHHDYIAITANLAGCYNRMLTAKQ